jgi:hypothetical protein
MCYHIAMSTPAGALAPTIQGDVVAPSAVVGPLAFPAHNFLNVIRDVIHRGNVYHSEDDLKSALATVDDFERRFISNDHQHVVGEDDAAPHEDVSARIPPRGGYAPVPSTAPVIDYNKLAAALMAAGFGQNPPAVAEGHAE